MRQEGMSPNDCSEDGTDVGVPFRIKRGVVECKKRIFLIRK